MKKYIGYALWLVALLIPSQASLLSTSGVGNITGLISFLVFLTLLFAGYALVDSSNATASESHGH